MHSRDDDVVYIWTTDDDVSCHGILAFEHYNLWLVLEIPEQYYVIEKAIFSRQCKIIVN